MIYFRNSREKWYPLFIHPHRCCIWGCTRSGCWAYFTHSNDGWNLYTCLSVALNGWFTLDLNNVLTAVDFICTNMCVMVCIVCSDSQTVHSTATTWEPPTVEMSNFDRLLTDIFWWGTQDLGMWLTPDTSNFRRHVCGSSTSHHGTGKESPRAPRSFKYSGKAGSYRS